MQTLRIHSSESGTPRSAPVTHILPSPSGTWMTHTQGWDTFLHEKYKNRTRCINGNIFPQRLKTKAGAKVVDSGAAWDCHNPHWSTWLTSTHPTLSIPLLCLAGSRWWPRFLAPATQVETRMEFLTLGFSLARHHSVLQAFVEWTVDRRSPSLSTLLLLNK